jgi:transcription antitermination factor NusG
MRFTGNQAIKILSGKFETAVGMVLESRDETEMVKTSIQGLINDVPVDAVVWLKYSQVEAL